MSTCRSVDGENLCPGAAVEVRIPPIGELHLTPRSTAQVYFYLANGIEIPPEHVDAGLVRPPLALDGTPFDTRAVATDLFTVHACKGHKPPPNADLAVKYRGYWYFIDDRDDASKRSFAPVLRLSRLDFGLEETAGVPFLTLSVGR